MRDEGTKTAKTDKYTLSDNSDDKIIEDSNSGKSTFTNARLNNNMIPNTTNRSAASPSAAPSTESHAPSSPLRLPGAIVGGLLCAISGWFVGYDFILPSLAGGMVTGHYIHQWIDQKLHPAKNEQT